MKKESSVPLLLAVACIGLNVTGLASLVYAFYFGSSAALFASALAFGTIVFVTCR